MRALGLMSGTSMDGVDAAVVETDGRSIAGFGATAFRAYGAVERDILRAHLGRWPGEDVRAALGVVQAAHINIASGFDGVALIGFHGQTLAHDPAHGRTHQLGDGAALAKATGWRTVWDFRSADVAASGQGAPLVPLFHHALAHALGLSKPTVFLNLGGVANITWVDPGLDDLAPGALRAGDTGPASALLDDLMQQRRGLPYDAGGALALQGRVDETILAQLLREPWFAKPLPKSADRNQFHTGLVAVATLCDADSAATLTAFTAQSIAKTVPHGAELLVMGGGRHNHALLQQLEISLGQAPRDIDTLGLNGDMIEAQAFAYLAVRVLHGLPTSLPSTTGCARPTCGGRISP